MLQPSTGGRDPERGSAMVIAMLVMVILTLLGISYLMMAETENRIAENEKLSAQALYAAESGVRQVKRWFDRPPYGPIASWNVASPTLAVVDRSLRLLDSDGDPSTAPVLQNGGSEPYYKQGVDLDGDGNEDIFRRPFRGGPAHLLVGTEAGPDMRISESAAAGATFLATLSDRLFGGYPGTGGVEARIAEIDIYGPPYINLGGNWTRYGMATVKVTARIYRTLASGQEEILAERIVKAVLNEMPYPGPFGPLHSCANLSWGGDFTVRWGAATAVGNADITNNHAKIASSWPRVVPPGERIDLLWAWDDDAEWDAYMAELDATNQAVEDPWFRFLSRQTIAGTPSANIQPWPMAWDLVSPLDDGEWPNHDNNPDDGSHSNILQNTPVVTCPYFDYEIWKAVAQSGGSDVHYYVWDNGTSFTENGSGTPRTFREITDNREGLFFFDTRDGRPPEDTDGDGLYNNLTPLIRLQGGTWGSRGFIYLNAESFQSQGVTGRAAIFQAPGEPFQDENQNGQFDAGERWINLQYPTTLAGRFLADSTDTLQDDGTMGASATRNSCGPQFNANAGLWGILFNNGQFEATGNAVYYGSVIAKTGIGDNAPAVGTPEVYWDDRIRTNWPPPTWDLPRVMITRWETDL